MSTEALEKVSDYITQARILLQDTISPYRYEDSSLVTALNLSLAETRRLRPDLIIYNKPPVPQFFSSADSGSEVCIELPFRQAVLNGLVGYAMERDQEDIEDARIGMFLGTMRFMLTGEKPRSNKVAVEQA